MRTYFWPRKVKGLLIFWILAPDILKLLKTWRETTFKICHIRQQHNEESSIKFSKVLGSIDCNLRWLVAFKIVSHFWLATVCQPGKCPQWRDSGMCNSPSFLFVYVGRWFKLFGDVFCYYLPWNKRPTIECNNFLVGWAPSRPLVGRFSIFGAWRNFYFLKAYPKSQIDVLLSYIKPIITIHFQMLWEKIKW